MPYRRKTTYGRLPAPWQAPLSPHQATRAGGSGRVRHGACQARRRTASQLIHTLLYAGFSAPSQVPVPTLGPSPGPSAAAARHSDSIPPLLELGGGGSAHVVWAQAAWSPSRAAG